MELINMVGMICGRLTVIARAGTLNGQGAWECLCQCGTTVIVRGFPLRAGTIQSCGCYAADQSRIRWTKHGKSRDILYLMLRAARQRAKLKSIPFELTIEDLPSAIPETCPVLGIPICSNVGGRKTTPNSPSIDRVIPALGYVKGNVRIISHRANQIKSDATTEELSLVIEYMRREGREALKSGLELAHETLAKVA